MAIRQTDSEPSAESEAESPGEATGYAGAVRAEQEYVTMLYGLLDQARERSEVELAGVRARGGAGGTHQARLERDVSAAEHEKRIAQLNLTERGLCFGRTDDDTQSTLYIGRIGLRDDDYDLKLIDWRAPAARPFYAATPRNPRRPGPPPAHLHQAAASLPASTTRYSTWTSCPTKTGARFPARPR